MCRCQLVFAGALPPWEMITTLYEHGYGVALAPAVRAGDDPAPGVTIVSLLPGATLAALAEQTHSRAGPWIAWSRVDEPRLTVAAYEAGALAVLPAASSAAMLVRAAERACAAQPTSAAPVELRRTVRRRYRAGDQIALGDQDVLEIEAGIVVQSAVQQDGKAVVVGIWGPQQLLLGHPDDDCCLQLTAQIDTDVVIRPRQLALREPRCAELLAARLRFMEAWAAMQARPYLDQRLLGLLELLAEQFGVEQPHGTLINVRLTHAMLAAATGATRSTITRLLGELRTRGLLVASSFPGERLCLRHGPRGDHRAGLGSVALAG